MDLEALSSSAPAENQWDYWGNCKDRCQAMRRCLRKGGIHEF